MKQNNSVNSTNQNHRFFGILHTPSASSMEIEPSEGSSPHSIVHVAKSGSSSASTKVLPEMQQEEDPGELVLENGFHTL